MCNKKNLQKIELNDIHSLIDIINNLLKNQQNLNG